MTLRDSSVPLLPSEQRFFAWQQPFPQYATLPILLRINQDIDLQRLEDAIRTVISRNEAFKITYDAPKSQKYLDTENFSLHFEKMDLSKLPVSEALSMLPKEVSRLRNLINLSSGTLINGAIIHLCDGQHRLLLQCHHIIADAASNKILINSIADEYFNQPAETSMGWLEFSDYFKKNYQPQEPTFQRLVVPSTAKLGKFFNPQPSGMRVRDMINIYVRAENIFEGKVGLKDANNLLHTAALLEMSERTKGNAIFFLSNFNGRNLFPHLNVKKTIGWFAQTNPLLLICGESSKTTFEETVHRLNLTNNLAWDWGTLNAVKKLPQIDYALRVNYVGSADRFLGDNAKKLFSIKTDNCFFNHDNPGPKDHPDNLAPYPMQMNGYAAGKDFLFEFRYCKKLLSEGLAKDIYEGIRGKIKDLASTL